MLNDDEDYMSDAFLKQIPDTRPGLVPKHIAKRHDKEKKERVANEKNRQKPKAVLEKEKRDEGLGAAISSENKGFSLLQKMGYKPGMALGKSGVGRLEPVPVEVKTGRGGLGQEEEQKRKKVERTLMYQNLRAKQQKMEGEIKQTFMRRLNEKISNKNVERDFNKCQKVCEQLDSQMGLLEPHEVFFWPEALLPKGQDSPEDEAQSIDPLEPGYSGYVQDVHEEEEEEEEEDVMNTPAHFTLEEKLDILTLYLRTKHKYCIWCGTKYNDKEDMMQHCPGNSSELHDDL
ncbi:G patch domain-containing protein 11-like isoform X2 [Dreissena polymorpha]|uniref:G patch domain-containing protein 11-like isoform X2 n=1 Tax=Dreissena polymorpha TaxID=45954 RepID=UPI0022656A6C|nr:G patch domain-containing protein 11-like isoform X2 [Dreissena polymorpha]